VHADIIARYKRLMGHEVFFSTGTDEHGQKIFQKAKEKVRMYKPMWTITLIDLESSKSTLNLSNTMRLSAPPILIIYLLHKSFGVYAKQRETSTRKNIKVLYCVGDEAFIKEGDLVDGKCPNHPTMTPIEIEEENYFFRLSKYQDFLLEYLARPDVIVPEWRREEAINFVKQGLEDFSISREKARMSWGVPVPGDDTQVMYVWFDALTNYISTLGWPMDNDGNFEKFWTNGEAMQVAGKDQSTISVDHVAGDAKVGTNKKYRPRCVPRLYHKRRAKNVQIAR
jgi:methionyl-tRNA synthetase